MFFLQRQVHDFANATDRRANAPTRRILQSAHEFGRTSNVQEIRFRGPTNKPKPKSGALDATPLLALRSNSSFRARIHLPLLWEVSEHPPARRYRKGVRPKYIRRYWEQAKQRRLGQVHSAPGSHYHGEWGGGPVWTSGSPHALPARPGLGCRNLKLAFSPCD